MLVEWVNNSMKPYKPKLPAGISCFYMRSQADKERRGRDTKFLEERQTVARARQLCPTWAKLLNTLI